MLHQVIEKRGSRRVNVGTMGFHDYEEVYDMTFEEFVQAITKKYNRPDIEVISISYLNHQQAVVVYKDKATCKPNRTMEETEATFYHD